MIRIIVLVLLVAGFNAGLAAKIHEVKAGASIQAAVIAASAGDTIKVFPGTYKETVYVDKNDITLSGVTVGGEWPLLDGENELNDIGKPQVLRQAREPQGSQ